MEATPTSSLDLFFERAQSLLDRVEQWLPPVQPVLDWESAVAWRFQSQGHLTQLSPVRRVAPLRLADLQGIDDQKHRLAANVLQFTSGLPANHVLLTGARGTGKSSLVRACLNEWVQQGLRLIEIDKSDLHHLPQIMEWVHARPERFLVFCDDLSFEEGESSYKALKSVLDGTVAQPADNVLIIATSNRRHLMPEYHHENATYRHTQDGEVHPGEVVEEKISLSERFGLWISFYPFSQDEYLDIAQHWLQHFGAASELSDSVRAEALVWALQRGSRSGRVAFQFAKDYAGRHLSSTTSTSS